MSIDFRLPNINAKTDAEKITQITKYIYQLTEQLNFSFNTIETSIGNPYGIVNRSNTTSGSEAEKEKIEEAYSSIKSMIIKSADFIESVSQKVNIELNGSYLAKSEFGDYLEKTKVTIDGNSVGFTELYTYTSNIRSDYGDFDVENKSYIKTGLLYYHNSQPVYGVGIGLLNSSTEFNGHSILDRSNLSVSVTPEKISFWGNDTELAYLTTNEVYFPSATITARKGSVGGWEIDEHKLQTYFADTDNTTWYRVLQNSELNPDNPDLDHTTVFEVQKKENAEEGFTDGTPVFYIRPTGEMHAELGDIGGLNISTNSIYYGTVTDSNTTDGIKITKNSIWSKIIYSSIGMIGGWHYNANGLNASYIVTDNIVRNVYLTPQKLQVDNSSITLAELASGFPPNGIRVNNATTTYLCGTDGGNKHPLMLYYLDDNMIQIKNNDMCDFYLTALDNTTGYFTGTWKSSSEIIVSSARVAKTNIESLDARLDKLFDNLIPRQFKYKNGISQRTHYGYILDELGDAIQSSGLTSKDCAAYCLKNIDCPDGDGGIRYGEFVALNTWQIQKLKERVAELERKLN